MLEPALIGRTIGSYQIISLIGREGMAEVYKAYEPSLDRYVAIKVMQPMLAAESGFAARFDREAKAIARLDHPNILPVHGYGQQDGYSFLVMRYVQAGTLKGMLGKPLDLTYIAEIIHKVGSALEYAHRNGILHRDIKPSNILMSDAHWPLLTDFGLARMMEGTSHLTGSGVGVGTPAYMSPEQSQGFKVDARADVYSLGVMLYEMVTGSVPYDADTPLAVVIKHITAPLPIPSQVIPGLPEAVERVILKALAKNPNDRFQSAHELVDALDRAVAEYAKQAKIQPEASVKSSPAKPDYQPVESDIPLPTQRIPAGPKSQPANEPDLMPSNLVATRAMPASEMVQTTAGPPSVKPGFALPLPGKKKRRLLWIQVTGAVAFVVLLALGVLVLFGGLKLIRDRQARLLATQTSQSLALLPSATSTKTQTPLPTATIPPTPVDTSTPSAPTGIFPVRIRLVTTSGWEALTVVDPTAIYTMTEVKREGEIQLVSFDPETATFRIDQDLGKASTGHQVTLEEEFIMDPSKTSDTIGFKLDSGCLNVSEVYIYNMVSQPPALVHHEKNQACGESVQFEVPVSALNTANPERTLQEIMVSRPLLPQALDTDSSKIVFVCEKIFPPQLCIRYVQSGRVEQLTKDLDFYEIKSPKWKPGGEAIYFTAIRWTWDDYSLYTIRKDGTGLNWEIWDQFSIIEAVWSPDETIYYIRDDCRVLRWVYPTERGHDNRILTGVPCFTSFSLSWSNTSNSQIAFVGWPGPTLSPTLWVAGKSPGDQRQIYQFPDPQSSYDWIEVSWNQEGDRVYAYFSQAGITKGILVDPFSAKDEPVSVFWETPVWWKPDFYPQWGK